MKQCKSYRKEIEDNEKIWEQCKTVNHIKNPNTQEQLSSYTISRGLKFIGWLLGAIAGIVIAIISISCGYNKWIVFLLMLVGSNVVLGIMLVGFRVSLKLILKYKINKKNK